MLVIALFLYGITLLIGYFIFMWIVHLICKAMGIEEEFLKARKWLEEGFTGER